MSNPDLPDFPRYSWSQTLARVQALQSDLDLQGLLGCILSAETADQLLPALARNLPGSVYVPALAQTLEGLYGFRFDTELAQKLCWLIAGNWDRLRARQSIGIWTRQDEPEWAPLFVEQVQRRYDRRQKSSVYFVTARAWGGSATACSFRRKWSMSFCRLLAARMGFTRRTGALPFQSVQQFAGLHFFGLLDPNECLNAPRFSLVHVSSGMQSHNRSLLRMRTRRLAYRSSNTRPFACPQNFPLSVDCHRCPVGADLCPAACHASTYVKLTCEACGVAGWHDPQDNPVGQPPKCCVCRAKELFP